jgi:hypothetical protein
MACPHTPSDKPSCTRRVNEGLDGFVFLQPPNGLTGELNGAALNGQFEETLPGTGTYTLVLSSPSAIHYSFEVLTPPARTFRLTLGGTVSSALTVPGQVDTYTFTGSPGEQLYLNGLGTTFNGITIVLNSPTGAQPLAVGLNEDQGPIMLTEAGTYSLVVSGNDGNTPAVGPYSFRLIEAGKSPAQGLTFDTPVAGTLNAGVQATVYQFIATQGHRLTFKDNSASSNQATWTVYGATDNEIASANIESGFTANVASTGIYTLVVAGSAAPALSYNIQVNDSGPASGEKSLGGAACYAALRQRDQAGEQKDHQEDAQPGQPERQPQQSLDPRQRRRGQHRRPP